MTTPRRLQLEGIADGLAAAAASTEARFVGVAGRLEQSVDKLATLTTTFGTLSGVLSGENLSRARGDLARVASSVTALARARGGGAGRLDQISDLTSAIEHRIARMLKSIDGAGAVAMNAKIAVAHVNDASLGLASFADEINRTLEMARTSLGHFVGELAGVRALTRASLAAQSALEAREQAAVIAIPRRLARDVEAIATRAKLAATRAGAVSQGSRRVGRRIGDAVMALQIGDITRQRIEHVDYALRQLAETLATGAAGDREIDTAPHAALVGFVCGLQAAQLIGTADACDREAEQILRSLRELAGDAREIQRLGQDVFGADEARKGGFLGELEQEVGEVDTLLSGFRAARSESIALAATVSAAVIRLVTQIVTVRSLEADLRMMGLNISFKCGRLGAAGRPLSIIAQELRGDAKEIAMNAKEVKTDLDALVAIVDVLSGDTQTSDDGDLAAVSDIMARSLACLARAGLDVSAAVSALEADGHAVAEFLREAAEQTKCHEEIGRALRDVAAALARVAPDSGYDHAVAAPRAETLLRLLADSYTMQDERAIFARHVPALARQPAAAPAPAAAVDDFLF